MILQRCFPNALLLSRKIPCVTYARQFFKTEKEKKQRRKELWNEAKQGYFSDFHEFRKNGGKISEAPLHLSSRKATIRFPSIDCTSLSGVHVQLPQALDGKVSLILLSLRDFGMKACDEYRMCFEKEFGGKQDTCVIYQLSVVEQPLYRLISGVLYRNLRRQIANERHLNFLYYSGKFAEMKKLLSIHNSIIGYCFLLDQHGFVRWRAHASPTVTELSSLIKCTKHLLNDKLT